MRLKFWGTRSVYPIANENSTLYGGNTLCLELRSHTDALVVVDAGTGIRSLGNILFRENFARGEGSTRLLLSHTYWSHLLGFPFCGPMYVKGNQVTISAALPVQELQALFEELTYEPFFPVALSQMGATLAFKELRTNTLETFGGLSIEGFVLPSHRAAYVMQEEDTCLAVIPTLSSWEELPLALQARLQQCRYLLLDAHFFLASPQRHKELRDHTSAETLLYGYHPSQLDAVLSSLQLPQGIILAREGEEHHLGREVV